ncbi:MAG: DUF2909 domain-containing protein [Gammaproteobacteria bacterium]
MWIKPAIVLLLLALLASLATSFFFLMKDQGSTKRTLHGLGVRVSLTAALVALIAYGFYTGELRSRAPWDQALQARQAPPQQPATPAPVP